MSTNSRERDLILEEIKSTGGNLSKVARALGLDYVALKQHFGDQAYTPFITATGPEPADITTLGRPGFEKFVVAVKRAGSPWPAHYETAIEDARRKFDAGTHEMFQTNDNGWVVQYLIPHLVPVGRRRFFQDMVRF